MEKTRLATAAVALALSIGVLGVNTASAQAQDCLHGQRETATNRDRREQALKIALQINAAEAMVLQPQGRQDPPLEQLRNIDVLPPGFQIQFHTDSATYSFSIKDTSDPCRYTIFSDQDRDVYEATPSRQGGVIVPVKKRQ